MYVYLGWLIDSAIRWTPQMLYDSTNRVVNINYIIVFKWQSCLKVEFLCIVIVNIVLSNKKCALVLCNMHTVL